MGDDYQISVGVKADFSDLKTQQKEATATLKEAQAAWEEAYEALGKAAEGGSEQAQAALKEYASVLEAAKARVAELAAAQEAASTAARADAEAKKAEAAATRELSAQTAIANQEMRVFEGSTMGVARAAGSFATQMLGMGPIAAAAFPVIGAVAMIDIVGQLIGTTAKFASDASALSRELGVGWLAAAVSELDGLGKEVKQVDDRLLELARDRDRIRGEQQAADVENVRLTQGDAAADYAKAGQIQQQIEALEKVRALATAQGAKLNADITGKVDVSLGGNERLHKELDQQVAEYQAATDQEKALIQQKNNLYLEAQQPQEKADKPQRDAGAKVLEADRAALVQMKLQHEMSVQEEIAYWQQKAAAFKNYPTQYAAVQSEILRLTEQGERQQAEVRREFTQQSIEDAREKQRQNEEINSSVEKAWEQGLKDQASAAEATAESAGVQIGASAKVAEARVNYELATGAINQQTAAHRLAAIHAKEYADRIKALEDELHELERIGSQGGDTSQQRAGVQNKITALQGDAGAAAYNDEDKGAKQFEQSWTKALNAVDGPFNQFVDHWLTSGQRMGAAFQKMGDEMAMNWINNLLKIGEKQLEHEITARVTHQTTNAMNTGSDALAASMTDALETQSAMKSLEKSAAKAAGKAWSALADIPIVGPALGAVAAAATFTGVMALAAFERGGVVAGPLGSAVPIVAHAGERVLSAAQTNNFEALINNANAGGSKGTTINFHDHSNFTGIDGASVASMARNNGQTWRRETMRQLRLMNKI